MNHESISKVLRRARATDLNLAYALICELESEQLHKEAFKAIFLESLESRDWLVFIIEWAGQEVGFCSLHFKRSLHHASEIAELEELVIDPNQRSRGIGQKALLEIIETCKERGVPQLELSTNKTRKAAKQFYLANGFADSHHKMIRLF